jgi:hypothetical protein
VRERIKEMVDYALRLEDEILELKGVCKYLEGICEVQPLQKGILDPRYASLRRRQALLK